MVVPTYDLSTQEVRLDGRCGETSPKTWALNPLLVLICNSQPPALHLCEFGLFHVQTLRSPQLVFSVVFAWSVITLLSERIIPQLGAGLERRLSALQSVNTLSSLGGGAEVIPGEPASGSPSSHPPCCQHCVLLFPSVVDHFVQANSEIGAIPYSPLLSRHVPVSSGRLDIFCCLPGCRREVLRGLWGLEPGCPVLGRMLWVTLTVDVQTSHLAHLRTTFSSYLSRVAVSSFLKGFYLK